MDSGGHLMASITFKAVLPKKAKLIDQPKLQKELRGALKGTGKLILSDFNKTTRTWSNKPSFQKKGPSRGKGELAVEVFTENLIYFFLTRGTRSHPVAPVRAKALRFQSGYKAKTRVRTIGSRSGGSFGPIAFSKGHMVKGIKARDFDKEIAKRRQKNLNNLIRLAFLRLVEK